MSRDSAGRPIRYRKWQNDGVSRYKYVTTRVRRERQRTWVWNEEQGGAKRSAELEAFNMSGMNGTGRMARPRRSSGGGYLVGRIGKTNGRGAGPEPAEAGSPETEPTAGVRSG